MSTPASSTSYCSSGSKPHILPLVRTAEIPFARRRLRPEQIQALQTLFSIKTHPTKEERKAVAEEFGIELKAISVWFQNKRRGLKKQSQSWSKDRADIEDPLRPSRSFNLTRQLPHAVSLDCVAASHERPSLLMIPPYCISRLPLTPRKPKLCQSNTTSAPSAPKGQLWEHIPSSPPDLPSSPVSESVRLSALRKTRKSLEWACAKARAERWQGEIDADVSAVDLLRIAEDDGENTEPELEEAITPDTSAAYLPGITHTGSTDLQWSRKADKENKGSPLEAPDMEAAMALIGFMHRHA